MEPKHVLVANLPKETVDDLEGILSRQNFQVDYLPSPRAVHMLIQRVGFDLLILGVPVTDMKIEDLLHTVRFDHMPCKKSSVLLLAEPGQESPFQAYIGKGASAVLPLSAPVSELEKEVGELTEIAPRINSRFSVKLQVQMDSGTGNILCQMDNVSASGMLVKTAHQYPIGTEVHFDFFLPGDRLPLTGSARVVRHTIRDREDVKGMGLHFLTLDGDGAKRLEAFINARLAS